MVSFTANSIPLFSFALSPLLDQMALRAGDEIIFFFQRNSETYQLGLCRRVQLYIMDLGSANGTFVNNNKIDPSKYVQLLEKDVLKFGFSSREYVLLHDQSKEEEEDLGVD